MNLIKEKERGLSHRELRDKFQVSVGAVSNILKRKNEYINDYETNRNKKLKRRGKMILVKPSMNVFMNGLLHKDRSEYLFLVQYYRSMRGKLLKN